jgi:2,5-diamino-6-(ribosylamino)-4(3H)-pyrimidinone 5'-phosphate reductase
MLPKVVIYNTISLDGAIKDFSVDIALHYEVAGRIGSQVMLVGSETARTGIEVYSQKSPEQPSDWVKPKIKEDDKRGYWAIADSRGKLNGLLHIYRQSGYGKDVIVLVSEKTPKEYIDYLKTRNYDYIVAGNDHVDYRLALEELNRRYGFDTVATDTGGVLVAELLKQGLVDEVMLMVAPEIVGEKAVTLFRTVEKPFKLDLVNCESIKGHVLMTFKVPKKVKGGS